MRCFRAGPSAVATRGGPRPRPMRAGGGAGPAGGRCTWRGSRASTRNRRDPTVRRPAAAGEGGGGRLGRRQHLDRTKARSRCARRAPRRPLRRLPAGRGADVGVGAGPPRSRVRVQGRRRRAALRRRRRRRRRDRPARARARARTSTHRRSGLALRSCAGAMGPGPSAVGDWAGGSSGVAMNRCSLVGPCRFTRRRSSSATARRELEMAAPGRAQGREREDGGRRWGAHRPQAQTAETHSDLEGRGERLEKQSGKRGRSPGARCDASVSPKGAGRQALLPLQRAGGGGKSTAPSRTRWERAEGHSAFAPAQAPRPCGSAVKKRSMPATHSDRRNSERILRATFLFAHPRPTPVPASCAPSRHREVLGDPASGHRPSTAVVGIAAVVGRECRLIRRGGNLVQRDDLCVGRAAKTQR